MMAPRGTGANAVPAAAVAGRRGAAACRSEAYAPVAVVVQPAGHSQRPQFIALRGRRNAAGAQRLLATMTTAGQ